VSVDPVAEAFNIQDFDFPALKVQRVTNGIYLAAQPIPWTLILFFQTPLETTKKSGADMFLKDGGMAYQHACAAATQNILLTAHPISLGSLWFTLSEKDALREILSIAPEKDPLALICVGKPAGEPFQTPRKTVQEKTTYRE
jgi:nitroreductase